MWDFFFQYVVPFWIISNILIVILLVVKHSPIGPEDALTSEEELCAITMLEQPHFFHPKPLLIDFCHYYDEESLTSEVVEFWWQGILEAEYHIRRYTDAGIEKVFEHDLVPFFSYDEAAQYWTNLTGRRVEA